MRARRHDGAEDRDHSLKVVLSDGRAQKGSRLPADESGYASRRDDGRRANYLSTTTRGPAMLARIWRTKLDISRIGHYERFATQRSFPMFKDQPGFLGVLFARQEANCAVITFWDQPEAIEALESSPVYLTTVAEINQAGVLVGEASVDVLDIQAGEIVR